MGSNYDPSVKRPTWGEFYSLREFVDQAVALLRVPPHRIEHVTRSQVRALVDALPPKRGEPLASWGERAVEHWVAQAKAGLSSTNRRFPCA